MSLIIDEADHPRVRVRWTEVLTDGEVLSVLAAVDRWLARGVPFTLLIDARGGWPFSAPQRAWVIDRMRATRAATDRLLIQALVIDNPLVRALYFAVSWAFPMGFPSRVFSEVDSANAWLEAQLRSRERQRPPAPPP
jgi:hypothetical protein